MNESHDDLSVGALEVKRNPAWFIDGPKRT